MKLEQSFDVEAPVEQVWAALVDVERVAPCLPGAAVTGRNDDGSYNGTFTIKIGPTTAAYTGKLEMRDMDEAAHSATMHAQGSDKRGQGGATATISSHLESADGGTRVRVVTDYHITGRLARFGRGGMIEDISERLLREFAGRLQSSLAGSGSAEAGGGAAPDAGAGEAAPAGAVTVGEGAGGPPADGGAAEASAGGSAAAETSEPPTSENVMPSPTDAAADPGRPASQEAASAADRGAAAPPTPPPSATPAAPPPPGGAAAPPPGGAAAPPPGGAAPPPPPPPQTPPTEGAPPVQGLSLVGGVLLSRIKRNPAPVVGAVGGLIVLRWLLRRR